eukprot:TRINITY_DN51682_c0_g1_i1.p1 TRINITY_DN51682_c0_g1~~TRINITY_DN51682_c0_g1_i1.p1  ORF type:complete len:427 (+),score=16.29 TRINITY_DN51682_c0_g1_i1:129-1409(+)
MAQNLPAGMIKTVLAKTAVEASATAAANANATSSTSTTSNNSNSAASHLTTVVHNPPTIVSAPSPLTNKIHWLSTLAHHVVGKTLGVRQAALDDRKQEWEDDYYLVEKINKEAENVVMLNIGGNSEHHTTLETLLASKDSMFTAWFGNGGWQHVNDELDERGCFLLKDGDPDLFREVLMWLRGNAQPLPNDSTKTSQRADTDKQALSSTTGTGPSSPRQYLGDQNGYAYVWWRGYDPNSNDEVLAWCEQLSAQAKYFGLDDLQKAIDNQLNKVTQPAMSLQVTVVSGTNLYKQNESHFTVVELSMGTTKRTSPSLTPNPSWDETFILPITSPQPRDTILRVECYPVSKGFQADNGRTNCTFGKYALKCDRLAYEKEMKLSVKLMVRNTTGAWALSPTGGEITLKVMAKGWGWGMDAPNPSTLPPLK